MRKEKTIIEQDENTRDIVEGIRLENESGRLLLNGTDISSTDAGDKVSLEPFLKSDRSSSGAVDQDNANAVENTGILLENFGQLLLDGSDNSGTDAGHYLVQETTKNNRFNLERSGSIVTEDFDTSSVVERLVTEMNDGDNFILEELPAEVPIAILLENEGENDVLVLDGTNASGDDAGDQIIWDITESEVGNILLETLDRIVSSGQIPLENRTLNSSAKNTIGITRSSEILVRTTGDIALEDGTVNDIDGFVGHGMLVLNGTDSSSTNAGDNFDLEGATGITF